MFGAGWVDVTWDSGSSNSYRMGAEGKFDLALAASHDPDKLQKNLASVRGVTSTVGAIARPKPGAPDGSKTKVMYIGLYIIRWQYVSKLFPISVCTINR